MNGPRRLAIVMAWLLPALAGGGCGEWQPVAVESGPELDCSELFPRSESGAESDRAKPAASRLAQELSGWAPADASGPATASAVVLAGRLVGELAGTMRGNWRGASDDAATLLVHADDRGPPDALLYAETFSPLMATRPSEELARFALTVDPTLLDERLTAPSAATAWVDPLASHRRERRPLRRLAWMATTRTGGRGIGYTSSPDSFTGWKWMGRSRNGVFLRLARSRGEWSAQPPLGPEAQSLLLRLVQRFPQLGWLATDHTSGSFVPDAAASRTTVPASMVLGTASTADTGIHLAVVCAQTPDCAAAAELAELLESLRPGDTAAAGGPLAAQELTLEGFAAELGLSLAGAQELLQPGRSPS